MDNNELYNNITQDSKCPICNSDLVFLTSIYINPFKCTNKDCWFSYTENGGVITYGKPKG